MRFKNVKHAEYKILQHMRTSGAMPLSVVMTRGIPGYKLGHSLGIKQPLKKSDETALDRYETACKNLNGVITNMLSKRRKDVPEDDLEMVPSPYLNSWGDRTIEYGPEDDLDEEE